MSGAARLATDLLNAYKNIVQIKQEHKNSKLEMLRSQKPGYKHFDFEHPYHDMEQTTKQAEQQMKNTIKAVMDVEIDGSTVRKELEKLNVIAYLSSKPVDETVIKLLKL
jgi:hypothetical protein